MVNNGDRASAVVVSLSLPRQMTIVRAPAGCSRVGAFLRCKLGALRAGQSLKLTVVLQARLKGKGTVRATASAAGERQAKDNVASVAVKVA